MKLEFSKESAGEWWVVLVFMRRKRRQRKASEGFEDKTRVACSMVTKCWINQIEDDFSHIIAWKGTFVPGLFFSHLQRGTPQLLTPPSTKITQFCFGVIPKKIYNSLQQKKITTLKTVN